VDIIVNFDQSVSAAPAAFENDVNYVVNLFDTLFTNNVTVTISVGWGELDGVPMGFDDLGESQQQAVATPAAYAGIRAALISTASSSGDSGEIAAASTLPTADPTNGGNFFVGLAQEKALDLTPAASTETDGYIGFDSSADWSYAPGATPKADQYDLVGCIEHELTEDMGRTSTLGQTVLFQDAYTAMDLYRYSAPGARVLSPGTGDSTAYFSTDGGVSDLGSWNNVVANGDLGDWYPQGPAPGGDDAFNDYSSSGVINEMSPTDIELMNVLGWNTTPSPSVAWSDLNGDGMSDILFRNAAGVTYLWTMNGSTVEGADATSTQNGTNWQIEGIGDFNGGGSADLLWVYDDPANASDPLNGVSYLTVQNGTAATSQSGVIQQLPPNWQVAGIGDFNGDGRDDVLYRYEDAGNAADPLNGKTYVDLMNGTTVESGSGFTSQQETNSNWQVVATGNFGGPGETDILWRYDNAANAADPLNGDIYFWAMNGTQVASASPISQEADSANWTVAGTGDFSGDGRDDILFRYDNTANASDPLNGMTYIDFMNGATVTSGARTQWEVGENWQVASIGDYNGDGKADILWQEVSTGQTYIWEMNGANVTQGVFTSQNAPLGWTVQNGVHIG
jgi:hypothetical protein